jgi:hypothetical protein
MTRPNPLHTAAVLAPVGAFCWYLLFCLAAAVTGC